MKPTKPNEALLRGLARYAVERNNGEIALGLLELREPGLCARALAHSWGRVARALVAESVYDASWMEKHPTAHIHVEHLLETSRLLARTTTAAESAQRQAAGVAT